VEALSRRKLEAGATSASTDVTRRNQDQDLVWDEGLQLWLPSWYHNEPTVAEVHEGDYSQEHMQLSRELAKMPAPDYNKLVSKKPNHTYGDIHGHAEDDDAVQETPYASKKSTSAKPRVEKAGDVAGITRDPPKCHMMNRLYQDRSNNGALTRANREAAEDQKLLQRLSQDAEGLAQGQECLILQDSMGIVRSPPLTTVNSLQLAVDTVEGFGSAVAQQEWQAESDKKEGTVVGMFRAEQKSRQGATFIKMAPASPLPVLNQTGSIEATCMPPLPCNRTERYSSKDIREHAPIYRKSTARLTRSQWNYQVKGASSADEELQQLKRELKKMTQSNKALAGKGPVTLSTMYDDIDMKKGDYESTDHRWPGL